MIATLLPLLSPILGDLLNKVPDIIDALQRKDKSKMSIIKNAVNESKKLTKGQKNLIKRKLGIIQNAVNEDAAQGSISSLSAPIVNPAPTIMLTNGDSSVANESAVRLGSKVSGSKAFADQFSDSIMMTGTEFLQSVSSAGTAIGDEIAQVILNPRLFHDTRLGVQSTLYQRYVFESIELIYEPIVSKMTPGNILLGVLENAHKPIPSGNGVASIRALMEIKNTVSFPVYQVQTLTYQFHNRPSPLWLDSTYSNDVSSNLVNQAKIFIADGSGLAPMTYGNLYIKYRVHFFDAWIDRDVFGAVVLPTNVGTFLSVDPKYAQLSLTAPQVVSWNQALPPIAYVRYFAAFFDTNEPNMSLGSGIGSYTAGRVFFLNIKAQSSGSYPVASASFTGYLYPTEEDMFENTNAWVWTASPSVGTHNITIIPLFTAFDYAVGRPRARAKALKKFSEEAKAAEGRVAKLPSLASLRANFYQSQ